MKIEQIYTGCLAQGAYYILSDGEAAIIDPLRETAPYLKRAEKDGVKIKYVFETHFHADFVSGHLDLAKATGAEIVYGPTAKPDFEAHIASDGEEFSVGKVKIRLLHTPGHTLESSVYLLLDEQSRPHAIFTGDTLFLGDVGRPDLAQKAAHLTQEDLAAMLYDSLMNKIMPLPGSVIVYPGHGAGSACGKNMMKETVDTLAHQKEMNYALKQPDKESFVKAVTDGLLPPPAYFPMNVAMNKKGYTEFNKVIEAGTRKFEPADFAALADAAGALVLDVRKPGDFAAGFIPRSVNIGLDGQFAPWVGALVADVKQPLLLVCDPGREEEAVMRLSRVGFDHVAGCLKGGFDAWKSAGLETDRVERISAEQFAREFKKGESLVVDVRRESEYRAEHVEDAFNKPLDFIAEWAGAVDSAQPFYLHCAGGYRSMIAASILKSRGIYQFKEIDGGFSSIAKTEIPRTDFVCQSKVMGV